MSRDGSPLAALPPGAVVGTSSPRRAAAIARLRPDLVVRPIRGNVDTRIAKVRAGEFDATVLAVAGVTRLGRAEELTEVLDDLLPAPAQGALAVECRADDVALVEALAHLDDPLARLTTRAEREVLVGIDATCTTAIAASARYDGTTLRLRAELAEEERHATAEVSARLDAAGDGIAAGALGLRAAAALRGAGPARPPVLLVRRAGGDGDVAALAALGIPAISDPYVRQEVRPGDDADRLADRLASAGAGTWVVATSPAAVPSWAVAVGEDHLRACAEAAIAAGARAAATGERTAETLRLIGFSDVVVPAADRSSAEGLLEVLASNEPGTALLPCGALALATLPDGLVERGWSVEQAAVYDTASVDAVPASTLLLAAGEVAAVVLRSPSAVQALTGFVRPADSVRVVCAGRTTERAARAAGLRVDAVASSPDSVTVAATVDAVLGRGYQPVDAE